MALDIGAVTIDYSAVSPYGAASKYALELMEYEDIEEDYWKVTAGWHVFLELMHSTMVSHAMGYIQENGLTETEANEIVSWVTGLPWQGGRVMLHLARH